MRRQVAGAMVGTALIATGCGGSSAPSLDQIESEIRRDYQAQLTREAGAAGARVNSVDCVDRDDNEARCIASVSGALNGTTGISVTIGDDGEYIWETDQGLLAGLTPGDGPPASAPTTAPAGDPEAELQATLEGASLSYEPNEPLESSSGLLAEAAAIAAEGGSTGIVVEQYASEAEAREAEDDYLNALARPEGGRAAQTGPYLVFVSTSESSGLSESEISDFNRVVDALRSAQ